MTGGEWAFIALLAIFALFMASVWWVQHQLVKRMAELLASRSFSEWAAGQNVLAKAEAAKKGEKRPEPTSYNNVF